MPTERTVPYSETPLAAKGPLAGLRVLDVTQVMAGAYCSMLLADLGADVVKIERPQGDPTRTFGEAHQPGDTPAFMAVNRNKRGMVLDLADLDGAVALREMAKKADVLVENPRPGVMTRLGLDFAALRPLNPGLIYCSISGFGGTGPYAERGGFDLVAQAMSGLISISGSPAGEAAKVGVPICDLNAGMLGALGVMAAYAHRLRTGEGQHVDTSLLEAGIATTVWETALWTSTGEVATPTGTAHRLTAPYQVFEASDGPVAIGAANQATWERLCDALARTDLLDDQRFGTPSSRHTNRELLASEINRTMRTADVSSWLITLEERKVPAGPVYTIDQVHRDPQARARKMLVEVEHPSQGATQQLRVPIKFSGTPAEVVRAAPRLGEHTQEILDEYGVQAPAAGEAVAVQPTAAER